jgi:hypothetical protein
VGRKLAADRALAVARGLTDIDSDSGATTVAVRMTMRTVAGNIMVFAGIPASQVQEAMQKRDGDPEVATPAPTPRMPFNAGRWRASN